MNFHLFIWVRAKQSFERGEYELAIDYLNDSIKNNPKNSTYYLYRAISYLALNKNKQATEDALKILEFSQNWPKVYTRRRNQ